MLANRMKGIKAEWAQRNDDYDSWESKFGVRRGRKNNEAEGQNKRGSMNRSQE